MGENADAVVKAALRLSKPELEQVVERLLASLDDVEDKDIDSVWAAEAQRRFAQLASGEVQPIAWPDVRSAATVRDHERG